MKADTPTRWQIVATNIKTGERRVMTGCRSEAEAEAYVTMAVMRRGVETEFFSAEPEGAT